MEEPSFDDICSRMGIEPEFRRHVVPTAPARGKMAVARGMLPAPPKVLLSMIYVLLGDGDAKVQAAAEESLLSMPPDRLQSSLDKDSHPKLLEFLVYRRLEDTALMEALVLFRQLNDKTICYLAERGKGRVPEIISNNHERLIITPQLVHFLEANPESGTAVLERVRSFQRLYGITPEVPEGLNEPSSAGADVNSVEQSPEPSLSDQSSSGFSDQKEGGQEPVASPPERTGWGQTGSDAGVSVADLGYSMPAMEVASGTTLPPDFEHGVPYIPPPSQQNYRAIDGLLNPLAGLFAAWGIPNEAEFLAPPDTAGVPMLDAGAASLAQVVSSQPPNQIVELGIDLSGASSLAGTDFAFGFDEDDEDFGDDLCEDRERKDEAADARGKKTISEMKIGDKIKLAYKGNKSAREILVRDTNKVVATAVIRSGRVTDGEVLSIATNRSIHEEVIRELSMNREYLRKYPVKVALANNPKTPIPTAITLLSGLHIKDLQQLASNRNVSSAVFTAANRLYRQKRQMQR